MEGGAADEGVFGRLKICPVWRCRREYCIGSWHFCLAGAIAGV